MINIKRFVSGIFAVTLLFASAVFANEPSDLPEQFMKQVVAGKGSAAVDQYFATNPLIKGKEQQVLFIKTQIESVSKVFGKPLGYELVTQETIAPSLRRFVYISKHEYHALTWEFFIYKPRESWIASNMNFDDDFSHARTRK
jgi:hypothetical protein